MKSPEKVENSGLNFELWISPSTSSNDVSFGVPKVNIPKFSIYEQSNLQEHVGPKGILFN